MRGDKSMEQNIENIKNRLEQIKIQVAINEEKIKSSLQELESFLNCLNPDFINELSVIVPNIKVLDNLTIDQIQGDSQNIIGNQLADIISELKKYLDNELDRYEGMM